MSIPSFGPWYPAQLRLQSGSLLASPTVRLLIKLQVVCWVHRFITYAPDPCSPRIVPVASARLTVKVP